MLKGRSQNAALSLSSRVGKGSMDQIEVGKIVTEEDKRSNKRRRR